MTSITFSLTADGNQSAALALMKGATHAHLSALSALLSDLGANPVIASALADAAGDPSLPPFVARQLLSGLVGDSRPAVSPLEVL